MEKEHDTYSESISSQFSFNKNRGSIGKYNTLVATFAKRFLWGESGGDLVLAYSQKNQRNQWLSLEAHRGGHPAGRGV